MAAWNTIVEAWVALEEFMEQGFMEILLRDLDPSLFQNIILGILAIFIPFAIVLLTDVLDQKRERSKLDKKVLQEEVLSIKMVFYCSISGIAALAFFSGEDVSILRRFLTIIFSTAIISALSIPLWKAFRFSKGNENEFLISLLKRLKFSKFLFNSETKSEEMIETWKLVWSDKLQHREDEITGIFIESVNNAIHKKKYHITGLLVETYKNGLYNRTQFIMSRAKLYKIFEWNEKCLEENPKEKKGFISIFSSKNSNKIRSFKEWDDHYKALLIEIIKKFISDKHFHDYFFILFNTYILTKKEEGKYGNTNELIYTYCDVIFNNIDTIPGKHLIWERHLPGSWKITMKNSKTDLSKKISSLFFYWARSRILNTQRRGFDKTLSATIGYLLPYVERYDFLLFLMLCSCSSISDAVQYKYDFYDGGGWNDDLTKEELLVKFNTRELSQKKLHPDETLDIIFEYFKPFLKERILDGKDKHSDEYLSDQFVKMKLEKILSKLNREKMIYHKETLNDYQKHLINFSKFVESLIERFETLEQSSSNP